MNNNSRRMTIALAISVIFNLFLVGFVTARFVLGRPGRPGHAARIIPAPSSFYARDYAGAREPMKRFFRQHADRFEPRRKELLAVRQRVARALAAEPFDPESLRAALAELRTATADSQVALHNALVITAGSATPAERRMLSASRLLRLPGQQGHPRGE